MSVDHINNDLNMVRLWRDNEEAAEEQYIKDNPDSLIPLFENELRAHGFKFETSNQAIGLLPHHEKVIVPIAVKYYKLAKNIEKSNEQEYFLQFLYIKGFDDIVPMLLEDYYSEKTADLTRWFISDCIYKIRSRNFISEYVNIVSNRAFGRNRQMIVLLLGKLKEESTVTTLIDLLRDDEVCLQAICALGEFKREEFRCCFEQFQDSAHPGLRKYARAALKKLDSNK